MAVDVIRNKIRLMEKELDKWEEVSVNSDYED